MSENKTKSRGNDHELVSLSEEYEACAWAAKFGVSEVALRTAVGRVGNRAEDVEREIRGLS